MDVVEFKELFMLLFQEFIYCNGHDRVLHILFCFLLIYIVCSNLLNLLILDILQHVIHQVLFGSNFVTDLADYSV